MGRIDSWLETMVSPLNLHDLEQSLNTSEKSMTTLMTSKPNQLEARMKLKEQEKSSLNYSLTTDHLDFSSNRTMPATKVTQMLIE